MKGGTVGKIEGFLENDHAGSRMILVSVCAPAGAALFQRVIWIPVRKIIVADDMTQGNVHCLFLSGKRGFQEDL